MDIFNLLVRLLVELQSTIPYNLFVCLVYHADKFYQTGVAGAVLQTVLPIN